MDESRQHPVFDLLPAIFRDCVERRPRIINSGKKHCIAYPQAIGDHVYATDGRMCVRAPLTPEIRAALPVLPEGKAFPRADEAFGPASLHQTEPVPLPSLADLPNCKHCDGKGILPQRPCDECEGTGMEHCPYCEHDHVCDECDAKGSLPECLCLSCEGTLIDGAREQFLAVGPGVSLSAYYLDIFQRNGPTLLFLPAEPPTSERCIPVRFTVAGAEGVVMPGGPSFKAPKGKHVLQAGAVVETTEATS